MPLAVVVDAEAGHTEVWQRSLLDHASPGCRLTAVDLMPSGALRRFEAPTRRAAWSSTTAARRIVRYPTAAPHGGAGPGCGSCGGVSAGVAPAQSGRCAGGDTVGGGTRSATTGSA